MPLERPFVQEHVEFSWTTANRQIHYGKIHLGEGIATMEPTGRHLQSIAGSACREFRGLTRRTLLRIGSLSWLGIGLAQWFQSAAARSSERVSFGKAKRCLLLFMWGGPSQLETWDLKPDAPEEVRGEFRPTATSVPGIHISEHFPRLAQRVHHLAIIRSMTHTDVNHTSATHYLLTGHAPPSDGDRRRQWPHFGAVLARLRGQTGVLPSFIQMRPKLDNDVPRFVEESQGQGAGWLGPAYDPWTLDARPDQPDFEVAPLRLQAELSIERLEERDRLRRRLRKSLDEQWMRIASHELFMRRALELLTNTVESRNAFDLQAEPQKLREQYGLNPHGQSVLLARRLLEYGVPLVTVFWPNDGIKNVSVYWDTHSRNFIDHRERLMPVADQAFATLLDDLEARGLLEETLVIWTGEFGRTPRVGQRNSDAGAGRDGRDQWPNCFSTVLAGGGVRGGQVYGKSDRFAAYPAENPVSPAQLAATVYHLLGVAHDAVVHDVEERPHFVRPGAAIDELI